MARALDQNLKMRLMAEFTNIVANSVNRDDLFKLIIDFATTATAVAESYFNSESQSDGRGGLRPGAGRKNAVQKSPEIDETKTEEETDKKPLPEPKPQKKYEPFNTYHDAPSHVKPILSAKEQELREFLKTNPNATRHDIADKFEITVAYADTLKWSLRKKLELSKGLKK